MCLGLAGGRVERLIRLSLPEAGQGAALAGPEEWLFLLAP
jgi:hypothetical protein